MRRRGLISQSRMGPDGVVIVLPSRDDGAGLGHAGKDCLLQQFVTHPAIESLYITVLHGPARGDVVPLYAMILCPFQHDICGQFDAVVGRDHHRSAPPGHQRTAARHSRVTSSTIFSTRKRLPTGHERNPGTSGHSVGPSPGWARACRSPCAGSGACAQQVFPRGKVDKCGRAPIARPLVVTR